MSFKILIRNIATLGGICFASMSLILLSVSSIIRDSNVYLAASLDKENRLATVKAPRLIFVGGSNLALGLNSKEVEARLGLNVINMGLHAGLGLSYPLNEAQAGLRRNDSVILCIEHFLSDDSKKLTAQLIDVNPKAYKYVALSFFEIIRLYTLSVQRCMSGLFYKIININHIDIYNRQGFTVNGDLTTHFGKPKPSQLGDNVTFVTKDYSNGIEEINQFIRDANRKGATVFFTFPVYPISAYKRNKIALDDLAYQYQKLLNCPILGTLESFVLPDQYFFDTPYHLDSTGVQKRTDIMINLLSKSSIKRIELTKTSKSL